MKKYAFGIDIGGTTVKIGLFSTEESQAGYGNQRSAIDVKRFQPEKIMEEVIS